MNIEIKVFQTSFHWYTISQTSAMCQQEICKYKNIMKSAMRKPLRQENMEMNKKCPWSSLLTKQISKALSFDCVKNFRSLAIHVTSIAKEQLNC